jgi:MFS family permease
MTIDDPHAVAVPAKSVEQPTRVRYGVLAFLCALTFILYLDRACLGQATVPIQKELEIDDLWMGFVHAAFTLAYCLFEVPTGRWGDRFGSRGVLTRIVLWWSVFTALTGAVINVTVLIVVRFLFGAGEAGALPNVARVVNRWFPFSKRGQMQGFITMAMLIGSTAAPIMTAVVIEYLSWRWAFALYGLLGVIWAGAFYVWFRDDPASHPRVNDAECRLLAAIPERAEETHPPIPWGRVLTSANVWLMGFVMSCGSAVLYFTFSWYSPYLQRARGVPQLQAGNLNTLVMGGAALGCILGGYLADLLLRKTGNRRWARSGLGGTAYALGSACLLSVIWCDSAELSAVYAALAMMFLHMHVASWWAVTTDISGPHLGALFGLMNSMGIVGAAGSQLFVGAFVQFMGQRGYSGREQWDPIFYVYMVVVAAGAIAWVCVDATKSAVEVPPDLKERRL